MQTAGAQDKVADKGEIEPWGDVDVEVGEGAVRTDGCANDAKWGGEVGGVGVVVVLAVDALWHLLVVGVGGSEQLLVVGGWWSSTNSGGWYFSWCW